jgi:5-formyltetrahydrofolate cyclo-ligase
MHSKSEIRSQIKTTLNTLSELEKKEKSTQIMGHLNTIEHLNRASRIAIFIPLKSEPALMPWILEMHAQKKSLLAPWLNPHTHTYQLVSTDLTHLHLNTDNIQQPSPTLIQTDLNSVEVMLVPGMAFDRHGNRLGRGKGHYDTLLAQTSAIKIGICYSEQVRSQIPIEPHDIKMDMVVTDQHIYSYFF